MAGISDYQIVETRPLHVGPLISSLGFQTRLAERSGLKPRATLRLLIDQSAETFTAVVNGKPLATWGFIGTSLGLEARVWFCISDQLRDRWFAVAREARRELARALEVYAVLTGTVAIGDERSIRFARFLGFEVHEDVRLPGPFLTHPIRMSR